MVYLHILIMMSSLCVQSPSLAQNYDVCGWISVGWVCAVSLCLSESVCKIAVCVWVRSLPECGSQKFGWERPFLFGCACPLCPFHSVSMCCVTMSACKLQAELISMMRVRIAMGFITVKRQLTPLFIIITHSQHCRATAEQILFVRNCKKNIDSGVSSI